MAELIGRGEGGGGAAEEGGGEALEGGIEGRVRVRVWGNGEAVAPPVVEVKEDEEEEEEEKEHGEGNGEVNGDENGAREVGAGPSGNGEGGEWRRGGGGRGEEVARGHGWRYCGG